MEERLARLETTVAHIQSDVTEVKAHIVRLDHKIDQVYTSLNGKIDGVRISLDTKIDGIRDSIESLKRGRLEDKLWALLALAALLGVMARGFNWI